VRADQWWRDLRPASGQKTTKNGQLLAASSNKSAFASKNRFGALRFNQ